MYNSAWDSFFGNPIIKAYIEEAEIPQDEPQGEDTPQEQGTGSDLEALANDLKEGNLDQEDLISMYKAGKLTKDEISQIVSMVEGNPEQAEGEVDPETGEPQPTEEELLAQQIDQTNDLFVKFSIYDKIQELSDKLQYFEDNFEDLQSGMYERVLQLKEFLNILSNLVFNIETSVAYQMYGSILLQLTELFTEYNEKIKQEETKEEIEAKKNEPISSGEEVRSSPSKVEDWGDENMSHLMPDNGQGN